MRTAGRSVYDFLPIPVPGVWRLRIGMARRHRAPWYLWGSQLRVETEILRREFRTHLGRALDVEKPRTFNEKIQWRKLFDRREILPLLADKYRVRKWVEQKVGKRHLIPLISVADSADDIPFEEVPTPFIAKPTNASGVVFPVRDRRSADLDDIRTQLRYALRTPYGLLQVEWAYAEVKPRVIVERLLLDDRGRVPPDMKVHCFGGRASFVEVHVDRFGQYGVVVYSREWEITDLRFGELPEGPRLARPADLPEILAIAEELASGLDYVRVDLYSVKGNLYVGELTLYPASGFRSLRPAYWDDCWGELWELPEASR